VDLSLDKLAMNQSKRLKPVQLFISAKSALDLLTDVGNGRKRRDIIA
jgi:hypothetical protein